MKKFIILFFLISLHITITNAQTKGSFELMDAIAIIGISKSDLNEDYSTGTKVDILEHRVVNVGKYSGSYYTVHYVKHIKGDSQEVSSKKDSTYDMPVKRKTSKSTDNVSTTKFLMINSSSFSGLLQIDDKGVIVLLADEIRFLIKSIDTLKPDLQSYDYSSKIGMKKTIQFTKDKLSIPETAVKIFDFGVEVAFYKKDNQPRKIIWFLKNDYGFKMYPDNIDKFRDILEKSLDRMEEF